jgi:hypothetical protein
MVASSRSRRPDAAASAAEVWLGLSVIEEKRAIRCSLGGIPKHKILLYRGRNGPNHRAVAEASEAVFTSLPVPTDVEAVALGPNG